MDAAFALKAGSGVRDFLDTGEDAGAEAVAGCVGCTEKITTGKGTGAKAAGKFANKMSKSVENEKNNTFCCRRGFSPPIEAGFRKRSIKFVERRERRRADTCDNVGLQQLST
jgi:hypothetical protein